MRTLLIFALGLLFVTNCFLPPLYAEEDRLVEASRLLCENIALGSSLEGHSLTPEQASEIDALFEESLSQARAAARSSPRNPQARRLVGLVLCTAFRPVEVSDQEGNPITIVRRGGSDCEEGLAELRAALRLSQYDVTYRLDYAEALFYSDELTSAEQEARAIWDMRSKLSGDIVSRSALLLATCAQRKNEVGNELRWLVEALTYNPHDEQAGKRFLAIADASSRISWLSYEPGRALAAREGRPILMVFSADSCGWCKRLEQDVLPDPQVVRIALRYLAIQVNSDRRSDLTRNFRISAFPTTVLLNPAGTELHRFTGYRPADEYAAELRKGLPPY